jgi:hypothetical protein
MQHTTHSGYLKLEVYKDLERAYVEHSVERACYLTAELASTRGELPALLDCFIGESLAQRGLSNNAWVLVMLAERMHLIRSLPKREIWTNPVFQKALCEMTLAVALQRKRLAHSRAAADLVAGHQLDEVSYHEVVEPLVYGYADVCTDVRALEALFASKVSNEVFNLLKLLFWLLAKKRSVEALQLAAFLVQTKEHFVDELTDEAFGNEVKKVHRKDMVWYVWKTLLVFVELKSGLSPHVKTYVDKALALYMHQFKKRVRLTRINLLYHALRVACLREAHLHRPSAYEAASKRAASQIGIVYHELCGGGGNNDDGQEAAKKEEEGNEGGDYYEDREIG